MKKFAVVLLSLLLVCLCAAASADTYAVVHNTSSLNLRSGPSAGYTWLGSANQGDWVRVTGESGNWYQVELLDKNVTRSAMTPSMPLSSTPLLPLPS